MPLEVLNYATQKTGSSSSEKRLLLPWTPVATEIDPARFSVFAKDDPSVEVVGLRAETKLWLLRSPDEYPDDFLGVFEQLASDVRPTANWWKNYDMGEFKPASARAWSAPSRWLERPDKPGYSFVAFEHPSPLGAGRRVLHFSYHPESSRYARSNASYIRQVLPYRDLADDPAAFVRRTLDVAGRLPFMCGHCGYSLEISRTFRSPGQDKAYPIAMRHHGLGLHTDLASWRLRDTNALDTVNWLTLVGAEALKILGGRPSVVSELSALPDVTVHELDTGLVVQAGPCPEIGSGRRTDLKPYRAVYGVLRPALELHLEWNGAFQVVRGDRKKKTERWHTRLG